MPLPSADMFGIRLGPLLYHDALVMSRALLAELASVTTATKLSGSMGLRRKRQEVFVATGEKLLDAAATGFWSEHGDRAQVVSMAACCGASRPALYAVGRWKASGSAEYARAARAL
eukprot:5368735-Lingulodinium_polyedra.AAC.1